MTAAGVPVPGPPTSAGAAVGLFLESLAAESTRRVYGPCLRRLVGAMGGPGAPLAAWTTTALTAAFGGLYADAAAATWNARVAAVRSFLTHAAAWGWMPGDVELDAPRAPAAAADARLIPEAELAGLLAGDGVPVRERALWSALAVTGARVGEVLAADVGDVDVRGGRIRVVRAGGGVWLRYREHTRPHGDPLAGLLTVRGPGGVGVVRGRGPLFLATHRSGVARAAADVCPWTGRGRLSAGAAEDGFRAASGRTLGQLRRTAAARMGRAGWSAAQIAASTGYSPREAARYVHRG